MFRISYTLIIPHRYMVHSSYNSRLIIQKYIVHSSHTHDYNYIIFNFIVSELIVLGGQNMKLHGHKHNY